MLSTGQLLAGIRELRVKIGLELRKLKEHQTDVIPVEYLQEVHDALEQMED